MPPGAASKALTKPRDSLFRKAYVLGRDHGLGVFLLMRNIKGAPAPRDMRGADPDKWTWRRWKAYLYCTDEWKHVMRYDADGSLKAGLFGRDPASEELDRPVAGGLDIGDVVDVAQIDGSRDLRRARVTFSRPVRSRSMFSRDDAAAARDGIASKLASDFRGKCEYMFVTCEPAGRDSVALSWCASEELCSFFDRSPEAAASFAALYANRASAQDYVLPRQARDTKSRSSTLAGPDTEPAADDRVIEFLLCSAVPRDAPGAQQQQQPPAARRGAPRPALKRPADASEPATIPLRDKRARIDALDDVDRARCEASCKFFARVATNRLDKFALF